MNKVSLPEPLAVAVNRHGPFYFIHFIGFYIQPEVIQFTKHPHSQVLLKNTSLILECALDLQSLDQSVPIPTFKWQYNGDNDSVHCENSISYRNSSIVSECLIESVIVNDTGWYRCAVIDGDTNCTLPCYSTITVSASAYVLVIGKGLSAT